MNIKKITVILMTLMVCVSSLSIPAFSLSDTQVASYNELEIKGYSRLINKLNKCLRERRTKIDVSKKDLEGCSSKTERGRKATLDYIAYCLYEAWCLSAGTAAYPNSVKITHFENGTGQISVTYWVTASEWKRQFEAVDEQVTKIVNDIKGRNLGDKEAVYAIADWLYSNCEYDYRASKIRTEHETLTGVKAKKLGIVNAFSAYGVLIEKRGVCLGFASAFKYIADRLGIPCKCIIGKYAGAGHAWVGVQLDGVWRQLDISAYVESRAYTLVNPLFIASTDNYLYVSDLATYKTEWWNKVKKAELQE